MSQCAAIGHHFPHKGVYLQFFFRVARPAQGLKVIERVRFRIPVRNDVMHLYPIFRPADDASISISLACLRSLLFPGSDVRRCFPAAPEMTSFRLLSLKSALHRTIDGLLLFCCLSRKTAEILAAKRAFQCNSAVAPPILKVAVGRAKSSLVRLSVPIPFFPALLTSSGFSGLPSREREVPALIAVRSLIEAGAGAVGPIAISHKLGSAGLADMNSLLRFAHLGDSLPLKPSYWRQAVANLETVDEPPVEQASLIGLHDDEELMA